jgi:acetylornithine deacetylase
MSEATELLRSLVRIPSINPMGRPASSPHHYEHAVTAFLDTLLRPLAEVRRQPIAPLRENVVATFTPAHPSGTLVLEVHQDTVPVEGMTIDPFAAEVRDGRLYGRGACDVKGGMASMLSAFLRLCREKPARSARVVLACTADEEFTFLGVQRLAQDDLRGGVPGPIGAVVAEPTGLEIVDAHKGVARWVLATRGTACHSSRPDRGVNAIYRMARLLTASERYAAELAASPPAPRLGPPTLSVGTVTGGTSVNIVPDHCQAEVDRRLIPGEDPLAAPGQLAAYLRAHVPEVPFEVSEPYLYCPPLDNALSAELTARLGSAIDAVRGRHEVQAVPYGTDASTLARAGIPSVVFGPGDIAQAHTKDEWIELAQVEAAAEVLYRLALKW